MNDLHTKRYGISEIFGPTIQGEGKHVGRPCFFIRFSGCNLWPSPDKLSVTCPWCDTPQLHNKDMMSVTEIAAKLNSLREHHGVESRDMSKFGLVLTGGEPLIQLDDDFVLGILKITGKYPWIDVETNGTIPCKLTRHTVYYNRIYLSCSPKTTKIVIEADWYKILVPDKISLIEHAYEASPNARIYLQPVEDKLSPENTAKNTKQAVDLALSKGYSLSIQLHKVLSLP